MSLIFKGRLVYPLKQYRIKVGDNVVYDRDTRGKSWFILEFRGVDDRFIPLNSTGLVTSDGKIFKHLQQEESV